MQVVDDAWCRWWMMLGKNKVVKEKMNRALGAECVD